MVRVPLILSDQTILCGDPKSLLVPHPKEPVSIGQLVYFVLSASLFRYFHADTVTFLGSFHGLMLDMDGIYFYFNSVVCPLIWIVSPTLSLSAVISIAATDIPPKNLDTYPISFSFMTYFIFDLIQYTPRKE